MKCVKTPESVVVLRVSDDEAFDMVKTQWTYCPKHEWKNYRDRNTNQSKNKHTS